MKTFKLIDLWMSLALIIGFTITSLVRLDATFLTGYFVVGGWQVISMFVHAINGWFCERGSKRFNYHCIVVVTIAIALLGFAVYPLLFIFLPLLFAAPFMAIGYCCMCYDEVYVKMQRPLSLLK